MEKCGVWETSARGPFHEKKENKTSIPRHSRYRPQGSNPTTTTTTTTTTTIEKVTPLPEYPILQER